MVAAAKSLVLTRKLETSYSSLDFSLFRSPRSAASLKAASHRGPLAAYFEPDCEAGTSMTLSAEAEAYVWGFPLMSVHRTRLFLSSRISADDVASLANDQGFLLSVRYIRSAQYWETFVPGWGSRTFTA